MTDTVTNTTIERAAVLTRGLDLTTTRGQLDAKTALARAGWEMGEARDAVRALVKANLTNGNNGAIISSATPNEKVTTMAANVTPINPTVTPATNKAPKAPAKPKAVPAPKATKAPKATVPATDKAERAAKRAVAATPIVPMMTGSVQDNAMLVDLTVNRWAARKTDKKASQEVATSHNSDVTLGHYVKKLVESDTYSALRRKADDIYIEHRRRTLPWLDGGIRVLSSAGYFEYQRVIGTMIDEYKALVDAFLGEYPSIRAGMQNRLNGLFDADDYPHASKLREKFGVDYRIYPFPNAADFRVQLSATETARVRSQIERSTQDAMQLAMRDIVERVKSTVGKMVERLTAYKVGEGGKPGGVFRDSLVENVRELVGILPTLNVTGSVELDEFTRRMRDELLANDADTLRDSLAAREATVKSAQAILKDMEAFV